MFDDATEIAPTTGEETRAGAPDRPRAADRAEMAIRRPSRWPAWGVLRAELLVRRYVARRWLEETDRELASTLARRRLLIERIDACTLALAGTRGLGRRCLPLTSSDARVVRAFAGSEDAGRLPALAASEDAEAAGEGLSGQALCRAVVDLVMAVDMPVELAEMQRLLALQGVTVAGRPSQTLSNALRHALATGELVRPHRGWYAPGPAQSE